MKMSLLIKSKYRLVRMFLEYEYIEEIMEYEVEILERRKRERLIFP